MKSNAIALINQLISQIEEFQEAGFGSPIKSISVTLSNIDAILDDADANSDEDMALACLNEISFTEEYFDGDCEEAIYACDCAIRYLNGEFSE